jgi:hypothetical protein
MTKRTSLHYFVISLLDVSLIIFSFFSNIVSSYASLITQSTNTRLVSPGHILAQSVYPIMLDAGYYNFDGSSSNWIGTLNTNRLCPTNYSPYFIFIPDATYNPDGGRAFLISYSSLTTNASNYSVHFNKQYGQDSGGIAFTWVMFCYPPSMSTPSYLPYGGGF